MALNERYNAGFLSMVTDSLNGEVTHIPNPLDRVGTVFKLMKSRYVLLSGATGSGKTSLADYMFILGPYDHLKDNPDIHWEVLYFSLERKEAFKHAKWVSWFIKHKHNMHIAADDLMGFGDKKINQDGYNFIRTFDDDMSDLLSHVRMFDGKVSPKVVSAEIERRAKSLGVLYWADEDAVYSSDQTVYIERFDDKNLVEHTKAGDRHYVSVTHKGKEFKLYKNTKKYFLHKPHTFVFIIIDGINLLGDKTAIDKISIMLANARDIYGFSPVVVTQQNRAMGDIQRMKLHGTDMSPQIEDILKSSQMGFDADVILGLFDPARYKALDTQGKYQGYTIKAPPPMGSMTHPKGFSRFRSLHILKNNFGIDSGVFGLRFTGESNYYHTLPAPSPENQAELDQIYSEISQGR